VITTFAKVVLPIAEIPGSLFSDAWLMTGFSVVTAQSQDDGLQHQQPASSLSNLQASIRRNNGEFNCVVS